MASLIKDIFQDHRGVYGTRRLQQVLKRKGVQISRRRIGRLMKEQGLFCKVKRAFKATTDSHHSLPIADHLLERQFQVAAPDQYYVGDITYLKTQEGWLYLAVVLDLFSRKIVGWAVKDHLKADLANQALLKVMWARKPKKGFLYHTDRGSQYASKSHQDILKLFGGRPSMSRRGNCWDNAVCESFFHTLKTELIYQEKLRTKEETTKILFEYIEVFYNRKRSHSANGYLSPVEFEETQKLAS